MPRNCTSTIRHAVLGIWSDRINASAEENTFTSKPAELMTVATASRIESLSLITETRGIFVKPPPHPSQSTWGGQPILLGVSSDVFTLVKAKLTKVNSVLTRLLR